MARHIRYYAVLGAIGMAGFSPKIARLIGAPIADGWEDDETLILSGWVMDLTPLQVRRLRVVLWRYGVWFVDVRPLQLAGRVPLVASFRAWAKFAERYPATLRMGWAFSAFAWAWRISLRLRGLSYRLAEGQTLANAVREDAERERGPRV